MTLMGAGVVRSCGERASRGPRSPLHGPATAVRRIRCAPGGVWSGGGVVAWAKAAPEVAKNVRATNRSLWYFRCMFSSCCVVLLLRGEAGNLVVLDRDSARGLERWRSFGSHARFRGRLARSAFHRQAGPRGAPFREPAYRHPGSAAPVVGPKDPAPSARQPQRCARALLQCADHFMLHEMGRCRRRRAENVFRPSTDPPPRRSAVRPSWQAGGLSIGAEHRLRPRPSLGKATLTAELVPRGSG